MLLKGVAEVDTAPDRRAAAEMVLIRLCHVADLPAPGDLVRRLTGGAPPAAGTATSPSSSGGARAVAGGTAILAAEAAPASSDPALPNPASTAPQLASFRDVVALVANRREAMLHAHLVHSVHLVRFAPPVIELRPQADAPRDLASKLAALLTEATGTRWTIALSAADGTPTLADQGSAADAARRSAAADHPLVRAIMEAFPGARIDQVHDTTTDAYGLPMQQLTTTTEDAPPDMDFSDEMENEE
jgi:DNA polymerase-3 subunit gamma/tau